MLLWSGPSLALLLHRHILDTPTCIQHTQFQFKRLGHSDFVCTYLGIYENRYILLWALEYSSVYMMLKNRNCF